MFFVFVALFVSGNNACHATITCQQGDKAHCHFTTQHCVISEAEHEGAELLFSGGAFKVTDWDKGGKSGFCSR